MSRHASVYSQVDLQSKVAAASPHRLIQLLYEGAISRLTTAYRLMESQPEGAAQQQNQKLVQQQLAKALDIVSALKDSLDTGSEEELPHNLDRLYDYIQRRLLSARIHFDCQAVKESQNLLEELKLAWDQISSSN